MPRVESGLIRLIRSTFFCLEPALICFSRKIAALTSSISMLEVPVAYCIEEHDVPRETGTYVIGAAISLISTVILLNFDVLFGLVVSATTRYRQPLLGLVICIYAGWMLSRDKLLQELRKGNPEIEQGWFWKIWPWWVRVVCPTIILAIFAQSFWG